MVELLTTLFELADYKNAISEAMFKGIKRNEESKNRKKPTGFISDDEMFIRFI